MFLSQHGRLVGAAKCSKRMHSASDGGPRVRMLEAKRPFKDIYRAHAEQ
jgi:hypothetical protein